MLPPKDEDRLTRRTFVQLSAAGGLSLFFGVDRKGGAIRSTTIDFAPNQWIRIAHDGIITIRAHKSEMGQGVRTALPAIVAAELGANFATIVVQHAEPGPDFPGMATSGSGSVGGSWRMLRTAAAAARMVLTQAAANRWSIYPDACSTENGFVVRTGSRDRIAFADLLADAASLAVPATPVFRPDAELRLLGSRLKRVDAPAIVRGAAVYGIDVHVPNMRVATIARPPVAGATLLSTNDHAALQVSGVERIMKVSGSVAVVASNSWAAIKGRTMLDAKWGATPAQASATSGEFLQRLTSSLGKGKHARSEGDVSTAMRDAASTLTATYSAPFQAHAAMEPLACVVDARADRCEIWVGTQRPNGVKKIAAEILGIPEDRVTVHITLIGGAFGRRIGTDYAREAIELSREIKMPVQVLWTREDEFAHDMYQPAQVNRLTASIASDGGVTGWKHDVADYHLSMFGAYNANYNPAEDGDPWGGIDTPYAFPALDVTLSLLEAPVLTGAWRSVSYPAAVFARESFVDEVARATKKDPVALRLSLISSPGNYNTSRGPRPNGDRLRTVITLAAERAGWSSPLVRSAKGLRRGRGIACNSYDHETMVAQIAEVTIGADGSIHVDRVVTAIDCGRIIDRSGLEAQVQGGVGWALSAALKTKVTFSNGVAEQKTFADFPVLRMKDMPAQDVVFVDGGLVPYGAGEAPVPAVFAAVANAVFDATGVRLRDLPLVRA